MKIPMNTLIFAMAALSGLSACKKQDDKPLTLSGAPMGLAKAAKKESRVVVPDALKGKWKAIRIAVVDKSSRKEYPHVVPVGTDYVIPGTGLTLRAENLLPDFRVGDGVITSKSDRLENPAVQVRIFEDGQERFKGWMFAKFPDTHSFDHPQYGLKLIEFVP